MRKTSGEERGKRTPKEDRWPIQTNKTNVRRDLSFGWWVPFPRALSHFVCLYVSVHQLKLWGLPGVGWEDRAWKCLPTPVYTVTHTGVCPHLYTRLYIQVFAHTCTHCHTYRCLPTPDTLSHVQVFAHTCIHCHTYRCLLTPDALSHVQVFVHTCTHCHTYRCFPTNVHTIAYTGVCPHMYSLSHVQGFAHIYILIAFI